MAIPQNRIYRRSDVILDDDSTLWRYMDFPKYASLLLQGQLFFCRLENMNDPYEGLLTRRDYNALKELHVKQGHNVDDEDIKRWIQSVRKQHFINCWHLSNDESSVMWSSYGLRGQSIAVTTTFAAMAAELPTFVSVGAVIYRDFETDLHWWSQVNLGEKILVLGKRREFHHESEVRFLFSNTDILIVDPPDTLRQPQDGSGFYVKLDVKKIIRNVYLDPTAPPWFYNVIVEFSEQFGLGHLVKPSTLMSKPDYA